MTEVRILDEIIGKAIVAIDKVVEDGDTTELWFETDSGEKFRMYHFQDCCEWVRVEEIIGDLDDLLGQPLLMAEEVTEQGVENEWGSSTWTFYKFATIKGSATIRWLGESNGYYGEEVEFRREEAV